MRRLLALLILIAAPAWAASYYVKNGGSDAADGLSDGNAWETIAKVNGSSFSAGDSILFKKGCTWREQLTVPSSGSAGNPITFGAYGTGGNPIIKASNLVTSWTENTGGAWDWAWDMEEALPGDWTSETDAGGKIDLHADAAHGGSYGIRLASATTGATLEKTGLTSTTEWHDEFWMKLSSDYSRCAGAAWSVTRVRLWFYDATGIGGFFIKEEPSGTFWFQFGCYNVSWSSAWVPISANTWYKIKIVGTTLTSATAHWEVYLDDVLKETSSALDMSVNNGSANLTQLGQLQSLGTADELAGYIYFDDGTFDQDGIGPAPENTWYAAVTTEPKLVIFNDTRGSKVGSVAACDADKKWYWASNVLYTYGTEDPNTTYPNQIEAAARNYAALVDTRNYITFNDLTLANSNQFGVRVQNATNFTFDRGSITQLYYQGTDLNYSSVALTDITFKNLEVSHAGGCGITAAADSDHIGNITISYNKVHDCGWGTDTDGYIQSNAGIKVWGGANAGSAGESDNALIEYNEVYDNDDQVGAHYEGSGIWVDQWGTGAVVRYNKVHGNASYGILMENTLDTGAPVVYGNLSYGNYAGISINRDVSGALVYNNSVYGNTAGGLICEGVGSQTAMVNNIFKNNISSGNGTDLVAKLGGENAGAGSGNVYLYNCLGAEAASFVEWGSGVYKSTYDAWESAYGGTTSSIEADPSFTNAAGGDFTLQAGSPCIEAGFNLGPSYIGMLDPLSSWPSSVLTRDWHTTGGKPDVGAYDYQKRIW